MGEDCKSTLMNRIDETVQFGDTECWTLTVGDGQHVFHVHQTMFQILAINSDPRRLGKQAGRIRCE